LETPFDVILLVALVTLLRFRSRKVPLRLVDKCSTQSLFVNAAHSVVDGTWVQFEDNACVITNEKGDVQGSDIKGPLSRESAERWPRIAANAKQII